MEATMVWTVITRCEHTRRYARYPSDFTDNEWGVVVHFVPPGRGGGRPPYHRYAGSAERHTLSGGRRYCVANAAEGLSSCFNGAPLFLPVAR